MSIHQSTVQNMVTARLPTKSAGEYRISLFHNDRDDKEHLALVRGEVKDASNVLVRIHSECFTGDVLGSERCDCGDQLSFALEEIDQEGRGVVLYLRQEGRGIGLLEKLKAYNLQDLGYDTVDANRLLGHAPDAREYGLAARMLKQLGIRSIRLLTNNPAKISGLIEHGVEVCDRVPIGPVVKKENAAYLRTKAERLQHQLDPESLRVPSEELESSVNGHAPRPETPAHTCGRPLVASDLSEIQPLRNGAGLRSLLASFEAQPGPRTRPFVTLTYAQSVDGCIAAQVDQPLAISGPQSRAFTHELRAAHDAILVGIGTVLADDPRLTVRLVDAQDPRPIVLDSDLRFPLDARLFSGPGPWIVTSENADPKRQAALEEAGAVVLRMPLDAPGRLGLRPLLEELSRQGIRSLMVEGGAAVISSFLASRLVDHLAVTLAPILIGGLPAVARRENGNCASLPRLRAASYLQLGEDLIIRGAPDWS